MGATRSRHVLAICSALGLVLALLPGWSSAQQGAGSANWQAGPGAAGDNTYVGSVEAPGNAATLSVNRIATISGWFVDTSAEGWTGADEVQVFQGSKDAGGTLVTTATLGLNRPDIAASLGNPYWSSAGWSATLDPGALPSGQNTLSVYVHTPAKGWWFTQLSVVVGGVAAGGVAGAFMPGAPPLMTVSNPLPEQRVSTKGGSIKITGTVRDPTSGPKGIDWVQVWLNGEQNSDTASQIGESAVGDDGSWSVDFSPGAFPAISSNLYVYAHSVVTGETTLRLVHFQIMDRPV